MGWNGRTLHFCYHRTSQGPAACYFTTHSGFDPELTETCTYLFLGFCRFQHFLESHSCSSEGYMAFKSIWRATQECIVALTEIMEKKKGDRLEEITWTISAPLVPHPCHSLYLWVDHSVIKSQHSLILLDFLFGSLRSRLHKLWTVAVTIIVTNMNLSILWGNRWTDSEASVSRSNTNA